MKQLRILMILSIAVLLVAAMAVVTPVSAQDWVPANGYWEVITNVKRPSEAIVKFYDLQGHKVFEEQVTGMRLDLRKRKTCRWLNKQLQTALVAWASRK